VIKTERGESFAQPWLPNVYVFERFVVGTVTTAVKKTPLRHYRHYAQKEGEIARHSPNRNVAYPS